MPVTGPTPELCLRVSAAALARVTFPHPETGEVFLALERKAHLFPIPTQSELGINVFAQPFGGGMRITRPDALRARIGDFHFDSPRSEEEQDFRIMVRPADWETVKQFCLAAVRQGSADWVETGPERELEEEFWDTLRIAINSEQYRVSPLAMLAENTPVPTASTRAASQPTARIYAVWEARLLDPALIERVLAAAQVSREELLEQARADAGRGGRGRANSVFVAPLVQLARFYRALPPERRGETVEYQGHRLEGNVAAVLPDIDVPKYERRE